MDRKYTHEELFSQKVYVLYEKEHEPETAVVMCSLQVDVKKTGVNSFRMAQRHKAAHWTRKHTCW